MTTATISTSDAPVLDGLRSSDGCAVLSERLLATRGEPQRRFLVRERLIEGGYAIEFRELDTAGLPSLRIPWPPKADGYRRDANGLELEVDHRRRTVRFAGNVLHIEENCRSLSLGTYMLAQSIVWAQANGLGEYDGWGDLVAQSAEESENRERRDRLYARPGFSVVTDDRGAGKFAIDRIAELVPAWQATTLTPLSMGPVLDRLVEAEEQVRDLERNRKAIIRNARIDRASYVKRIRCLGAWRIWLLLLIAGLVALPDVASTVNAGIGSVLSTIGR